MSETVTAPEGEIAQPATAPPEEVPRSPEEIAAALGEIPEAPPEQAEPEAEPAPEVPPEPEEEIEFDLGGTPLKVAKSKVDPEVAEAIAKWTKAAQAAHTRRSQELAEIRKVAEVEREQAAAFRKVSAEVQETYARGLAVKQEIASLEKASAEVSWQANPDEARRISDALARKRSELHSIVEAVAAGEQALEHAERQEADRRASQQKQALEQADAAGREAVRKAIPTFDSKAEAELIAYVGQYGITEEQAKQWPLNPATTIMAHKAMLWDRAKAAGTPTKPAPKPPAAPITGVQTQATGTPSDPAHMNTDQIAALLKQRGIIR